jgi:subtilase family serine protease
VQSSPEGLVAMGGRERRATPNHHLLAVLLLALLWSGPSAAYAQDATSDPLTDTIAKRGSARVLVRLARPFLPEPHLASLAHVQDQRRAFADVRTAIRTALSGTGFRVTREPEGLPFVALEVDGAALGLLRRLPGLAAAVVEDRFLRPTLAQSVPTVQANSAWTSGYDGTGTIVAILDTGVAAGHPFLAGKVVREACFSTNVPPIVSLCPGGVGFTDAPGSGAPCTLPDCDHGTHVAGIAAGGTGGSGSGVAKGAKIWAIQVFSRSDDPDTCFGSAPCIGAFDSDVMAALDYLFDNGLSLPGLTLAAVNLSLGDFPEAAGTCDGDPLKPAFDQLRGAGVASIVASGNVGFTDAVGSPACISTVVSVGSTGDAGTAAGTVSEFSNMAPFVSLLAPGSPITSSVSPSGFGVKEGTSMAAPHVTGAFAILRQAAPAETVDELLDALQSTGVPVTDTRSLFCLDFPCATATVPRMRIAEALGALGAVKPDLAITALSAPTLVAGGQAVAVSNTARNLSSLVSVGPFQVGFYLSTDATIDPATDTLLATRSVGGLPPNGMSGVTTTVTLPDGLAAGTYFIGAVADPTNAIAESSEANNTRASGALTVVDPDVATTVATAPASVIPGSVVMVATTVRNSATAPIGPFTVGLYRSTDAVLDGNDLLLATRTVAGLAAGATSTASTPVTIPANTPIGSYFVVVRADDGLAHTESDEANNVRATAPIRVGPDLLVTAVTAPAKALPGQGVSLSGTVQNVGTALLPAQTSTLAYYLSADAILDGGDVLLGTRLVPGLAAGAASAGATSVTIPAGTAVGSYFVIARADETGAIAEANEGNNTRVTAAPIVVGPDVAVTVATGPSGAAPGVPMSIANTVVNNGAAPATVVVAFYRSSDDAFDGGDVLLGSRTVTALAAGGSSAATTAVTLPASTVAGSYRVLVRADDGSVLGEANESNNVRATAPINVALPDLTVTALTAPAAAAPGATLSASHTVRNAAPAPGAAPASISRFYLSADAVLGGDVDLGTASVPALGAARSATVARTLTIPADTPIGTYFLLVRADDGNLVAETDDTNNTRATAITIGPDLVVTAVTAPTRAVAGQVIALSSTVRNAGTALLPAQTSTLAYYLSADIVLDGGDVLLGTRLVPGLGAGATSTGTTSVTIPAGTSTGTYFVIARADDANAVGEANETNNTRVVAVPIVVGPDLVVTAVTIPVKAVPGQTISVSGTVQNVGTALLPAQTSTLAYYLSTDAVLDGGDVPLGTRLVPGLGAGAASAAATAVTFPAGAAAGVYVVIASADDTNAISEARESNNTRATATPIVVGAPDAPLACDTTVTGTIVAPAETDRYTFTVPAGERVHISVAKDVGAPAGFQPAWRLLTAAGAPTASCGGFVLSMERDCGPLAAGTYRVEVEDSGRNATGSYHVHLQRLTTPCDATALACGMPLTGVIATPVDTDLFSLTLAASATVHLSMVKDGAAPASFQPRWRLLTATGTPAGACGTFALGTDRDCGPLAAGTYRVEVEDFTRDGTGAYDVTATCP